MIDEGRTVSRTVLVENEVVNTMAVVRTSNTNSHLPMLASENKKAFQSSCYVNECCCCIQFESRRWNSR